MQMSVAELTAVAARVEELHAVEEIKKLKARYFRFLDTKQWDELRALFVEDATIDFTPEMSHLGVEGGQLETVASFIERVATHLTGARIVHHGHMPEIEITSPTSARGIWAMIDIVQYPPFDERRGIVGYGHYEEEYVKVDGGWKLSSLRLTRLHVDGLPAELAAIQWDMAPAE
jgi:hypothetical protein